MKKVLTIVSVALVALVLSSCVENSKKYQTLLAEKEQLAQENQKMEQEFNTTLGILNEVENNLQAIRDAEGILMVQQEGSERDRIIAELLQMKEVMAANNARLDSLNEELSKSQKSNGNLIAQVKKLKVQIAEKEEMISNLQAQIIEKDGQISNLNTQVANLNNEISAAASQIENLHNEKLAQTNEMNVVYYIAGTIKELKQKGVVLSTKDVLKTDVPAELFTKADMRKLNTLTFETKKAVLLSNHPTESYTLVKGVNEEGKKIVTLEITNPEMFWKVTRYLVVVTK